MERLLILLHFFTYNYPLFIFKLLYLHQIYAEFVSYQYIYWYSECGYSLRKIFWFYCDFGHFHTYNSMPCIYVWNVKSSSNFHKLCTYSYWTHLKNAILPYLVIYNVRQNCRDEKQTFIIIYGYASPVLILIRLIFLNLNQFN